MKSIKEIEEYAKENYVPIARKKTVEFLINTIKENNFKSFLEIGTAIGYTSLILANTFNDLRIVTIEHNEKRAKIAKENFKNFGLKKRINFIVSDALTYQSKELFDLIFIDAAKKKNAIFLDKFSANLSNKGLIIVDNMNLDDFNQLAKKEKQDLYKKVNDDFKEYVFSSPKYEATLLENIGDGIMLIKVVKTL